MGKRSQREAITVQGQRVEKPKQQRRSRPGQAAPRRTCVSKEHLSDRHKRAYKPWAERKAREHQNWAEKRPALVESLSISSSQLQQDVADLQAFLVARVSNRFSAVQAWHCCSQEGDTSFSVLSSRQVRYQYFNCAAVLEVPTYQCNGCQQTLQPDAIACGCFQTSPVDASCWVDLAVLQFFTPLSLSSGLAATEFCKAIRHQSSYLDGAPDLAAFNDHLLEAAFLEFRRVIAVADDLSLLGVDLGQPDPFRDCPVCAIVSKDTLEDGTAVPPVHLSCSADAVNKLSHFKACGTAQTDLVPCSTRYFAESNDHAKASFDAQNLGVEIEEEVKTCSSALSCARLSAKAGRVVDIFGILGPVCPHGIPALGLFINMWTPEQYGYYNIMLRELLQLRPDLKDFYIDLACRYQGHWQRLVQSDPDACDAWANLRVVLPWMHGCDHPVDCQIKYSSLYKTGAGRRVGEQTEQLWKKLKGTGKAGRYMTHGNRQDHLDDALAMVTSNRLQTLPKYMLTRLKDVISASGACTSKLVELKAEAAARGVMDLSSALTKLESASSAPMEDLANDRQVKYVQLLLEVSIVGQVSDQRGAYALAFRNHVGLGLHAAVENGQKHRKLKEQLIKLEFDLDIDIDGRWTPDDPQYKAALQKLCQLRIAQQQLQVEDGVVRLHRINDQMSKELDKGHNATKLQKRKHSQTRAIEQALSVRSSWLELAGLAPSSLDTTAMKEVFKGKFPWQQPGSLDAAERHFAERFRHLSAESDRTSEEMLMFLPREMIRMRAYLEERVRRIRAATAKLSAAISQSNPYLAAICKGKQYLLRRWEHRTVSLLDEAVKCHTEALALQHPPMPA